MKNEVTKQEVPEVSVATVSPQELMQQAIAQGADLTQLEKLLEIQMKYEANEAKKAYVKAMSAFKANPPQIVKDKHVSYATSKGQMEYDHASLFNIVETISKALSKHGLSSAWKTQQNGSVAVTCTITHSLGHSEETTLAAGADTSGGKNSIQAIGSTVTYLQRYTLLALVGLATKDQDDDGKGTDEFISDAQVLEIDRLVKETGTNAGKLLEYAEADSYNNILLKNHSKIITQLRNKKGKTNA